MPKKTTKTTKPVKSAPGAGLSFEAALTRLETLVSQLEEAKVPLEKALALYEEGVGLARFCSTQLKDAERRVEILDDKNGQLQSRPFTASAGTSAFDPDAGELSEEEGVDLEGEEESPDDDDEEDDEDRGEEPPQNKKSGPKNDREQETLF